jgi:hypothetical protein
MASLSLPISVPQPYYPATASNGIAAEYGKGNSLVHGYRWNALQYFNAERLWPGQMVIESFSLSGVSSRLDFAGPGTDRLTEGRFDNTAEFYYPNELVPSFRASACQSAGQTGSFEIADVRYDDDDAVDRLAMRYALKGCVGGDVFGHVLLGDTGRQLLGYNLSSEGQFDLQYGQLEFGRLETGAVVSKRLELTNIGDAPLSNVVTLSQPAGVSLATTCSGPLRPAAKCTIDLRIDTTAARTIENVLTISNEFNNWGGAADGHQIPISANVVDPPPPPETVGGLFHSIVPTRFLDTRNGIGIQTRASIGNTPISVQITGRLGVPIDATGVIANLTVTGPSRESFLTVYPDPAGAPDVSNLNYRAGDTVANMATLALGDAGELYVKNEFGSAHVIVDVLGWIGPETELSGGDSYQANAPLRVLDTRALKRPFQPNETRSINLVPALGSYLPAGSVSAVVANVTVVEPSAGTFLTAFPADAPLPNASTVNVAAGDIRPNLTVIPVDDFGNAKIFNAFGTAHVLVDVVGWFRPTSPAFPALMGRIIPVEPFRLFDTRQDNDPLNGYYVAGYRFRDYFDDQLIQAFALNVTVTTPQAPGFLTVYRGGDHQIPDVSSLNFDRGETVPNQVWARLPTAYFNAPPADSLRGLVWFYNGSAGAAHIIVDVQAVITGQAL